MENEKVYVMLFAKVYPLLVAKAVRKVRTQEEVDELAKGKNMEKIKSYLISLDFTENI